jgi:hypothetical protein
MLRSSRHVAIFAALAFVAACDRNSQSSADSAALAADLALAQQTQPAYPLLQDSALDTRTETKAPATPARPVNPEGLRARTPTPRPRPVETVERPVETPRTPAPTSAVSRAPGFETGTSFSAITSSPICTTNLPGDKIVATLDAPVQGQNGASIPAGTTVVLEVASVTPGDNPEAAQISLRVRSIMINDEPVPVDASVTIASTLERREVPRDRNADRRKVVTGAIAGAVLGQIMGRDTKSTVIGAAAGTAAGAVAAAASRKYDACLPAGGAVRATTTRQITLSA